MESDEVFHLTAKFSSNSKVTDKHPILVNFKSRGGLLTTGARIDRAEIDLQTVEDGIALGRLALFENLPVKLLHQQHGGATSQDVTISSQLLAGRSGSEKRNYFFLRQGRLARENGLRRESIAIDVHAYGVIADHRSALQVDLGIKRITRIKMEKAVGHIEPAERQSRFYALQFHYPFQFRMGAGAA